MKSAIAASSPLRSGHFNSRMALFFTVDSPIGGPFYLNRPQTVAHLTGNPEPSPLNLGNGFTSFNISVMSLSF
jgi:hypothetical protein